MLDESNLILDSIPDDLVLETQKINYAKLFASKLQDAIQTKFRDLSLLE